METSYSCPSPSKRRRALAAYARRLKRDSFCAETVESEIEVEDDCDFALSLLVANPLWSPIDHPFAHADPLVHAASVLARAEALLYAW